MSGQLTQAKGRKARHKSGSKKKKREESKVQACKKRITRGRESVKMSVVMRRTENIKAA